MFCTRCGMRPEPGDSFCGGCGARLSLEAENTGPVASDPRERLLQSIERELARYPQLMANRSQETDLEISSVLADASWGLGKKRIEYKACLLAKSVEHTVVFWEMVKEVGSGMGVFGGFKVERYGSDGRTASGKVREKGFGIAGNVIDYEWDYAQTRRAVEAVVKANGWNFTTVLRKGKAMH